jgi:type IV pilus secretin PilQ/predicted competence protein
VSLDFQGADLRAVLRTFSEISGLNLVIDPTIQGTVDVALRDVPWDQALDIILRANKLGYVVDGTIVRVAPLAVLADEESQRRKLSEEQALAGELNVLTRSLNYSRASDLRDLLTTTVLSQRGSIQFDARTNTLIIQDLPDRLERAATLISTLDRAEPQVEIEARIVQTTREFARRLGVQWGFNGTASPALGNTLPTAFPNQLSVGGRTGAVQGPAGGDATSNAVNLGIQGATTAAGVALGSINGALNLDVALTAIERAGQGRILSTPKVSTQNNIEAEITQGIQIPIQTVANNTVTVTFRDAALTLRVTHPADRHAARPDAGAGEQRRDDRDRRHLREPRADKSGPHTGAAPDTAAWMAVQARRVLGREPRAVDLHHPAGDEAVGEKDCDCDISTSTGSLRRRRRVGGHGGLRGVRAGRSSASASRHRVPAGGVGSNTGGVEYVRALGCADTRDERRRVHDGHSVPDPFQRSRRSRAALAAAGHREPHDTVDAKPAQRGHDESLPSHLQALRPTRRRARGGCAVRD